MKTVLVTGGAGFIGSNLIKKLIDKSKIICLDNFQTGNRNNLRGFLSLENFSLLEQDVIDPIYLKNIDEIYHLACPASPPFYQDDPIHTIKTNFIGTLNVLELALKNKAKVLFASTSEVYGSPLEHPQKETYWGNVNPTGIRSCYDEGKRAAECLALDFTRKYKMDIRIIRIFNTYGPNMNPKDGRVVTNFIDQALNGKPLTLYGKGLQTRSFCYSSDLVHGIIKMMATSRFKPREKKIVNLGNPNEKTILFLAKEIIKLTKSNSKLIFKPLTQDDPPQRKPVITLAKKKLDWQPKITLKDGLTKTIAYIKKIESLN